MTTRNQFVTGELWPDNNGTHINAHGGGVLFSKGVFHWFGEHKIAGKAGNVAHVGVHVYSSTDLYNWKDEGIALAVSEDPASAITDGCVIERPKVLYNPKTNRFVMWFHLELKGQGYNAARVGVAVSERPTGPYAFVHSFHPNAGHWPMNVTEAERDAIYDAPLMNEMRHFRGGGADPAAMRFPFWVRDFAAGQMAPFRRVRSPQGGRGTLLHGHLVERQGAMNPSIGRCRVQHDPEGRLTLGGRRLAQAMGRLAAHDLQNDRTVQ